jgi:hypothetical protein
MSILKEIPRFTRNDKVLRRYKVRRSGDSSKELCLVKDYNWRIAASSYFPICSACHSERSEESPVVIQLF